MKDTVSNTEKTNTGAAKTASVKKVVEKFNFYRLPYKIKSRTESHMIQFAEKLTAKPTTKTIEELLMEISSEYLRYKNQNPRAGEGRFDDINVCTTSAGKPNFVKRRFGFYVKGKKSAAFTIREDYFKDSDKNYEIADTVLNPTSIQYE